MDKLEVQFFSQTTADINGKWTAMLNNRRHRWQAAVPRNSVMHTMQKLHEGKIPVDVREDLGKYYQGPYVQKARCRKGTLALREDWGGWEAWDHGVQQVMEAEAT